MPWRYSTWRRRPFSFDPGRRTRHSWAWNPRRATPTGLILNPTIWFLRMPSSIPARWRGRPVESGLEVGRDAIGVAGRGGLWLLLTPSSCDAAAKKQDSPRKMPSFSAANNERLPVVPGPTQGGRAMVSSSCKGCTLTPAGSISQAGRHVAICRSDSMVLAKRLKISLKLSGNLSQNTVIAKSEPHQ